MPFDFDLEKAIQEMNRKESMEASNQTGAAKTFYERSLFKNYAYSSEPASLFRKEILPIRDFQRYENYMYGRINTDFLATVPLKSSFVPFEDSSEVAFGFVTNALNSMLKEIKTDIASGKIPSSGILSQIKVTKAFEDIKTEYNKWVKDTIKGTFIPYVKKFKKKEKIVDFDSFVPVFMEHLMMIIEQVNVVNFSSFCLTGRSNIRNSGLCVEVANLNFSKDSEKIDFIEDPLFPYYVNMAQKHGFFVDYNAPWRLVYNLASYNIRSKSSWDGLYTFFSNHYTDAHSEDLKILKNICFTTYRDFVNRFKSFRKMTVEPNGCVKGKLVTRQHYTRGQFDKDYPDRYWIKVYIDLKNAEKNLNFDTNQLNRIKKKSLEYEKHVDIFKAMSYINKVFQDIPTIEGSFYYKLNKAEFRDQKNTDPKNLDKYVKEIVKSYKIK